MTLTEILEELVNLPIEYVTELGTTCLFCGFPLDKETRIKMVSQATLKIKELMIGMLPDYKISKPSTDKDETINLLEDGKILGWNDCVKEHRTRIEGI